MKRAVVLCGGGSRGSYEIGAWKALRELEIDYQIVVGNSIGALNGALMVQQDFEQACQLWEDLTIDQIIENGINLSLNRIMSQKGDWKKFLKNYVGSKGADISPLIELINRVVSEDRIQRSDIDFGILSLSFPSLKPVEITKSEMEPGMLKQHLLASASCFPAFPVCKINGKNYIDGGTYDDLPIDLAVKMGADEIIAVDLHYNRPQHPNYQHVPFVKYLSPSHSLGPFLDFEPSRMRRNFQLGYHDTLKAYDQFYGFRYTFRKSDDYQEISKKYVSLLAEFEARIPAESRLLKLSPPGQKLMFSHLRKHTGKHQLTYLDCFIRGGELCAEITGLDPLPVYQIEGLQKLLLEKFQDPFPFHNSPFSESPRNYNGISRFYAAVRKQDKEYLLGCIYHKILNSKDIYQDLKWIAVFLPKEPCAALYLYIISPDKNIL